MNAKGVAAAVVFLFLVSAIRLGDKPVFPGKKDAELKSKEIEQRVTEMHSARRRVGVDY